MLRTAERAGKRYAGSLLNAVLGSGRRPEIRAEALRSVLVVRQHNQLGDMLCAVPFLRAVRHAAPSAHITLVAGAVNRAVMLHNRFVDEVLWFDRSSARAMLALVQDLRHRRFDLALVPVTVSTSFTSDLLARLSGARVRVGCGARDGVENPSAFCFNVPVRLDWRSDPGRHQALRNMDLLAGLLPITSDLSPEITLTAAEIEEGRAAVTTARGQAPCAIAFQPGAGKEPNRWPPELFARVAELLAAEYGAAVFVHEGPMDAAPVAVMRSALSIPHAVILHRPIRAVAAILAAMDLVVTNDTGIMHVAAAVGAPVLSLFGPTDPAQWAPVGPRHRHCRGKGGRIEAIGVEEVMTQARAMLGARGSRVLA